MIFRCFREENLPLLSATGSEVNEAFFLATHTPPPLARVHSGRVGTGPATPYSEEEFEQALRDPESRFVIAIVHGSTGAGKSHLIRWLCMRLRVKPPPDTQLLLIRRSEGNLRQIIERIIGDLPGEFFDRVRQDLARGPERSTDESRREALLDVLAVYVDPSSSSDHGDPLAGLAGEARDNREYLIGGLPHLFRDRRFRRTLAEQRKIVDELAQFAVGSGGGSAARERPRQFIGDDFRLTGKLTPAELRGAATDETLQFAIDLAQNEPLRDDAAAYVNSCLPAAIQELLGLGGTDFAEIFRNARRALGPSKQLLLLIEDIAAFEFIDRQLLEALIEQPTDELCPLKSVVGVTDGYLERIDRAHLEKATLRVTLDVTGANAEEYRLRFAANYLNALRLPLEVMERHARSQNAPHPNPLPPKRWEREKEGPRPSEHHEGVGNAEPLSPEAGERGTEEGLPFLTSACTSCPYRPHCHASFPPVGEGDQAIGLFPFNPQALAIMHKATHGRRAGDFNPGAFIDGVLRATLDDQKEAFAEGRFPSRAYRTRFGPITTPASRIEVLKRDFGPHYEQALVIQELWGDVPTGVYETFQVPVKAQLSVTAPVAPPGAPDQVHAAEPGMTETSPPPSPPVKYPSWLAEALAGLDSWYGGGQLPSEARDTIRRVLRSAILSRIDWEANGLREADWSRVFDNASISLEGQGSAVGRALSIAIPRMLPGPPTIPAALALQGLLLASHHGGWDFVHEGQDGAHYLRLVEPFLEHIAGQVFERIRYYPAKGKPFDPLPAAVEMLAVAALLQGHVDELSSPDAWLNAILAPRVWTPHPTGPSGASFQKLVEAFGSTSTGQGQMLLRDTLLKTINRETANDSAPFIDAASLLPLIERVKQNGAWPATKLPGELQGGWESLKQLRRAIDQHLRAFLDEEIGMLRCCVRDMDEALGDMSKEALIQQARAFVEEGERLKVSQGHAGTFNIDIPERHKALLTFESAAFDQARDEARRIVQLAAVDLPTEGTPRLERLLPRIARLRHDILETWDAVKPLLGAKKEAMPPEVAELLRKAAAGDVRLDELTPEVLAWLRDHGLASTIRLVLQ
jgi:hypothetical protein